MPCKAWLNKPPIAESLGFVIVLVLRSFSNPGQIEHGQACAHHLDFAAKAVATRKS
ncbi:MAG: hypothetical protein QOE34_1947 [Verrucomicrobiota bacterium]|jgi:hypothetical protein